MLPLSSQKYEQKRDMSLRITVITLRDLGPYTCQAYNGQGRATSNTVTLYAMGPVKVNTPKDREYLPYLVERQGPSVTQPPPPPPTRFAATRYYPTYTEAPVEPTGSNSISMSDMLRERFQKLSCELQDRPCLFVEINIC